MLSKGYRCVAWSCPRALRKGCTILPPFSPIFDKPRRQPPSSPLVKVPNTFVKPRDGRLCETPRLARILYLLRFRLRRE